MKKIIIVLLGAIIALTSCIDNKTPVLEDFNREGEVLNITVKVYSDQKALLKSTEAYNTTTQVGLTVWSNSDNNCTIHVIKSDYIKSKQDETWGHELRHCVYGTFHKE